MAEQKHVFISYARENIAIARAIKDYLEASGYKVWLDLKNVHGGDKYMKVIHTAVTDCHTMLLLISKESQTSYWVPKELALVLDMEKPIIPVLIDTDGITDPEFALALANINKLDANSDWSGALYQIAEALGGAKDSVPIPPQPDANAGDTPLPPSDPRSHLLPLCISIVFLLLIVFTLASVLIPPDPQPNPPAPLPTAVPAVTEESLHTFKFAEYELAVLEDGTVQIIGYTGDATELTIPAELAGSKVTAIGHNAFASNKKLTAVTLPDTLRTIDSSAFESCTSLTSITLPEGLTVLGNCAFYNCNALEQLTLPSTLTTIGTEAFAWCTALTSMEIPDSVLSVGAKPFTCCAALSDVILSDDHPALEMVEDVLFSKADKRLICRLYSSDSTKYAIPDGTQIIGDGAFYGCSLKSVTIPDSVSEIQGNPFAHCTKLVKIDLSPDHPRFTLLNGVLFSKADKRLICYPGGSDNTHYAIPQGIQIIGIDSFAGCNSLTSVNIPDSATVIEDHAFYDCKGLQRVQFADSVIRIGEGAFRNCAALKRVQLPAHLQSLGNYVFCDCTGLTALFIPASVTSIGSLPFYNCPDLTLSVPRDSFAAQFAEEQGLSYAYSDNQEWLGD